MSEWFAFDDIGLPKEEGRYLFKNALTEFVAIVKKYNESIYWVPENKNIRVMCMTHWKNLWR
jgi:hypothetical protein